MTTVTDAPTRSEAPVVAAARAMEALLRGERAETEARRRLSPKIVSALVDARIGRMGLPAAQHGLDAHPVAWLEALELLAGFESAAPWIAWNNALACFFARFLSPAARAERFADPGWVYAQSTRPTGEATVERRGEGDGYRVSGRWSLVSGCDLADWLVLSCRVAGTDGEERFVFLERGAVEVLDTWDVSSMRGTGSHDVVVHDAFVPGERSFSPADPSTLDEPIGRVPMMANIFAGLAAQALGIAQSTVDAVTELARTRVSGGPPPDLRDRPGAQADVALHGTALAAARRQLHACVETVWDRTLAGRAVSADEIGAALSAALYVCHVAPRAVDAMVAAAGTAGLYRDLPIERAHRDLHAMMRHVAAQPMWLEAAGRVRFGLDPQNPLFGL